jgi:dienelactone hydrolase
MIHFPSFVRTIAALMSVSILPACQTASNETPAMAFKTPPSEAAAGLASGFYWRPASVVGQRWAILLPGASGLKVFDDEGHYFRAADALNASGFDVLVIDYKRAYKAAPSRPNVPTGRKIAWVVEQAVAWARQEGRVSPGEPAAIIAWSLGAEGLWPMLSDAAKTRSLGIKAAATYYPSNEDSTPITTAIPLLILAGDKDDVTPAADIQKLVRAANSTLIDLHSYTDANHGFDIVSIDPPKTVRLLPLIGPSGTFGYDRAAAGDAWLRLGTFLDAHVRE